MGTTLFTPSLPPRKKIKISFLLLIPMLPSASARFKKGGMDMSEASPRPILARPAADKNERRVIMLGITISVKLLFLETRQAQEKPDHAAHPRIVSRPAEGGKRRGGVSHSRFSRV